MTSEAVVADAGGDGLLTTGGASVVVGGGSGLGTTGGATGTCTGAPEVVVDDSSPVLEAPGVFFSKRTRRSVSQEAPSGGSCRVAADVVGTGSGAVAATG